MNIWFLASQFPPSVGGIARYVASAADMLAGAGHQVTVLAADEVNAETHLENGIRLIRFAPRYLTQTEPPPNDIPDQHPAFPYNVISHRPALSYEIAEHALKLVQRDGVPPDVIECQEYGALPYYLLQRRLTERHPLSATPVLVHMHTPHFVVERVNQEPRYRLPGYWIGQMEKFCLLAADALLSPSHYLKRDLEREVPQIAGQASVIPYPYPPLPLREGELTTGDLVYFGRLEVRKGILPLLQSCIALWERGVEFRLTLIGGDTQFAPRNTSMSAFVQKRYARWIQAGRLILQDRPLPPDALWERLANAWAVLVPSLWENYPNTCIEAMGLGKLVIGSTDGGQAEMIGGDGQAGLLFDWNTPGDCEAAIERALALTAEQVRAIGANARRRIADLTSFAHVLPQREAHYRQVIAQMQPRRSFPCVTPEITGNTLPPNPEEQPGLLSVVIPFYNLGRYLPETVQSILASTYRPLEIVVLDDGSDDAESLAILERLRAQHSDIMRVVRTVNGGLALARNRGAEAAHGEFITFVDADDTVEAAFFARSIGVLQRYENVSFIYSWVRHFGMRQGCWPAWNTEFPYLLAHNMLTAMAVVRRSDFLAYGRNNAEIAYSLEDHDSWISMVEQGCIGVSLPDMLVNYRIREDSMLRGMNVNQAIYLYDRIVAQHPDLYRRYGVELFNLLNANGRAFRWNQPAIEIPDEGMPEEFYRQFVGMGGIVNIIKRGLHWRFELLRKRFRKS